MPGGGGTQTLQRAVGERRAKQVILSAQPFTAQQAEGWGMVNEVCEPGDLLERALAVAGQIAGNGPGAVRQAKRAIHLGSGIDLKTGLAIEIECYNRAVTTRDRREGIAAFNEKRPPRFTGE